MKMTDVMKKVCELFNINPEEIETEESEKLYENYMKMNTPITVKCSLDDKAVNNCINLIEKEKNKVINLKSTKIVLLKAPLRSNCDKSHWDNLEEEYSKKFGCKVIILTDGIELIGINNG